VAKFEAGDISYVWTREGWLYLAIVLDLYSRRIVGWETSDRLKKDLAITALKRAIATRQPAPGLIHHWDINQIWGSQYCSYDYRALLIAYGMHSSMSGKGNCYDNSMVETVFKTIKSELVNQSWFGGPVSNQDNTQQMRLPDTSMASTIQSDGIQP